MDCRVSVSNALKSCHLNIFDRHQWVMTRSRAYLEIKHWCTGWHPYKSTSSLFVTRVWEVGICSCSMERGSSCGKGVWIRHRFQHAACQIFLAFGGLLLQIIATCTGCWAAISVHKANSAVCIKCPIESCISQICQRVSLCHRAKAQRSRASSFLYKPLCSWCGFQECSAAHACRQYNDYYKKVAFFGTSSCNLWTVEYPVSHFTLKWKPYVGKSSHN